MGRDLAAALGYLRGLPYVDSGRVVDMGCSYGGIMTILAAEANPGFRVAAAFALGRLGKDARPALPALLAALRDPARQVRDHAAGALWHFPDQIADGLPDLIELFREQEHRRRPTNTARSTMSRMGPRAAPAIPSLMVMLEDRDSGVRAASASVLGSIGPEAGIATAPLVEMLKDKEPGARQASAQALGSIGADARTAAAPLISLLNDSSCAHLAVRSLRKLGPDAVRPVRPARVRDTAGRGTPLRVAPAPCGATGLRSGLAIGTGSWAVLADTAQR